MKKVLPTKSAERELTKFLKAIDEFQCQTDEQQFEQVADKLLAAPKQPSAELNEGGQREGKKRERPNDQYKGCGNGTRQRPADGHD
jgi:hypothetical protein